MFEKEEKMAVAWRSGGSPAPEIERQAPRNDCRSRRPWSQEVDVMLVMLSPLDRYGLGVISHNVEDDGLCARQVWICRLMSCKAAYASDQ